MVRVCADVRKCAHMCVLFSSKWQERYKPLWHPAWPCDVQGCCGRLLEDLTGRPPTSSCRAKLLPVCTASSVGASAESSSPHPCQLYTSHVMQRLCHPLLPRALAGRAPAGTSLLKSPSPGSLECSKVTGGKMARELQQRLRFPFFLSPFLTKRMSS